MPKLKLKDWSQIAELAASIGVIVSLILVAISIERNNSLMSSQVSDETYAALRTARELILQDPKLLELTQLEEEGLRNLDGSNLALYKEWVTFHLDEWERLYSRERDGIIQSKNMEGWNEYFKLWFKKHVSREMWNDLRWRHTTEGFREFVDAEAEESE